MLLPCNLSLIPGIFLNILTLLSGLSNSFPVTRSLPSYFDIPLILEKCYDVRTSLVRGEA
ncbi:MAG: hypothetical protein D3908_13360 [Candidatus Electrothrix sp. AUS4]|nr:hypothetical protein [Candidatus Electrothrix sp. AUS4]